LGGVDGELEVDKVRGERELFFYGNKDVECVKQNVGYFLSRK
jgi:hypothetical protein